MPQGELRLLAGTDPIRITQKFEVHGVFKRVSAQPVESEVLKSIYPTMRELAVIERALALLCTLGVLLPIPHAMTARVSIRVDVDCDAKQVIGNLSTADGVCLPETTDVFGVVGVFGLVAALFDSLLNALECWNDTTIEPNGVPKE